ncbi:MAG TPA: amino acid permease [Candidatus Nanoarchaeia archaeon]|nr:amino acid permease [Candidatus Nanoarchaeia archaeon]
MAFHHKHIKLERSLGLFQVTVAGIGVILGAGVYVLIGIASGYAGNAVWLSFLIGALISIFTGFSYAELSSIFKDDAGEYEYNEKAFNNKVAWIVGMMVIMTGIISGATVALGFGSYFNALTGFSVMAAALLIVMLFSVINFWGIKFSSGLNVLFTFIETFGLLAVIALSLRFFGNVDYFDMPFGFHGILRATALIFFAYMGFETIVKLAEETKNPTKTIPKALIWSIVISSIIYVLVGISAVSVLGWETLSNSKAPLAEVAGAALLSGYSFFVLAIIALFSTSNTVLMTLVTTSRLVYGMAKKGSLPAYFGDVNKTTKTPWVAVLVMMGVTLLFTSIGKIDFVANLNDVFLFLTFATVNAANLALRYKQPNLKRRFKVKFNIGKFNVVSFLGLIVSLIMAGYAFANLL